MSDDQQIYCKAELIPHPITHDPQLQIIIDKNQSHFTDEPNTLKWQPSSEEQQFLKKVFELFNTTTPSDTFESFFDNLTEKQHHTDESKSTNQSFQKQQPPPQNTAETIEKTIEKHRQQPTDTDSSEEKINHIINKQKSTY